MRHPLSVVALLVVALATTCLDAAAQTLAVPGAEGAGRNAKRGRGGDVYHVTNLLDSGAGGLRLGIVNSSVPRNNWIRLRRSRRIVG